MNLSYGWCWAADAVSEKEFTFEVEFTLMLSWYDEQIFRKCDNIHPWAEPLGCPEVWRPKVILVRPTSAVRSGRGLKTS